MSTDMSRLSPRQWTNAEVVLRKASVAYLALVENGPLDEAREGSLATPGSGSGGGPYVVPINFVYGSGAAAVSGLADAPDPSVAAHGSTGGAPAWGDAPDRPVARVFFHTGAGRKTRALARNPRVCLAVTDGTAFTGGPRPCEDGFAYKSVLVWGRAVCLESREEREQALRAIVAKYDPGSVDRAFDERDFGQTLVYAVMIDTVSYKERPRSRPE